MSSQAQRFTRTDGSTAPLGLDQLNGGGGLDSQNEFTRLEQFAKVQAPPPVKFKDLEEIVSSRILRNQISFDYRFDFMRITGDTILVPVTVQIQNKQMTFRDHDGVQSASLNLFGRISSLTGRVIQTFEDVIQRDFPDSLLEPSLKGFSIYQKAVPLRPGLYKLDLVIKDVNSGNVGVVNTRLAVSRHSGRQAGSQLADPGRPDGAGFVQGRGRRAIRAWARPRFAPSSTRNSTPIRRWTSTCSFTI